LLEIDFSLFWISPFAERRQFFQYRRDEESAGEKISEMEEKIRKARIELLG
jgi:hypothetical protein